VRRARRVRREVREGGEFEGNRPSGRRGAGWRPCLRPPSAAAEDGARALFDLTESSGIPNRLEL